MTRRLRPVEIAGVGTTPFGKHLDRTLGSLACEAVGAALRDADLSPAEVEHVVFSNAAAGVLTGQEMIRGQVALKEANLTGIPVINTENACASGGSAVHLAWLAVASGQADVSIAVGAEKLIHQDKTMSFKAIESGTDLSLSRKGEETVGGSVMMGSYAKEARQYSHRYGDVTRALAAVAVKNRQFAVNNPHAQFQKPISPDEVAASREVAAPLRLLTCSPLTDGGAAIVLTAAGADATRQRPRVHVAASAVVSHQRGQPAVKRAATQAYRASGLHPREIDVFQLHDACAFAEVIQYEQVRIAAPGKGAAAALEGRTGPNGDSPVNTDGGLLSRGHALGATGLAQLAELVHQLRGQSGLRQIPDARRALSVNAGGWMGDDYAAAVTTLLATS